jgi:hypothetical protein
LTLTFGQEMAFCSGWVRMNRLNALVRERLTGEPATFDLKNELAV